MRIAVDATPLIGTRTGVATFVDGLLRGLARRGDVDVVAYALTWRGRQALGAELPEGVAVAGPPMAARPLREAWARFDVPTLEWWTGRVAVAHGTNFVVPPTRRAAEVVTVHDLTTVRFPELCTRDTLAFPGLVRRALSRGAFVHTPSAHVAAEVVALLGAAPERVVAVPHGIDPVARAPRGGASGPPAPARPGPPAPADRFGPYLLALGTVEPRKDLVTLLRAFDAAVAGSLASDLRLVVAGPDGWGAEAFAEALARLRHQDRVVRLGWVPAAERDALLAGATAFVYPSRYEGFGLPPLEAMAAGVPVVATDAGALPEVLGDAALLVPVGDTEALATAVERVVTDDELRRHLVAAGGRRVARFSWDAAAAGFVGLYRRAVDARG